MAKMDFVRFFTMSVQAFFGSLDSVVDSLHGSLVGRAALASRSTQELFQK